MGTATVKQDSGSKQNHLKAALRIDDRREQCRAVHRPCKVLGLELLMRYPSECR